MKRGTIKKLFVSMALCAMCLVAIDLTFADELTGAGASANSTRNNVEIIDAAIKQLEKQISLRDMELLRRNIYVVTTKNLSEKKLFPRKHTTEDQRKAALETLGNDRYLAVEDICMKAVDNIDVGVRRKGMVVLSQLLGSRKLEEFFQGKVESASAALQNGKEPKEGIAEAFDMAEFLAFLGNKSGVYIIESALGVEGSPSGYKRRAMYALEFLKITPPDKVMRNLLLSRDDNVAYDAFEWFGIDSYSNKMVIASAIIQLQRASTNADLKLTANRKVLLMLTSNILLFALRSGCVSESDRGIIRDSAIQMMRAGIPDNQICIGTLFGTIATDSEIDLIDEMLTSDDVNIVIDGMLALSRCSPSLIKARKKLLISNLESKEQQIQFFALYTLTHAIGEKSSTLFTEEEFQTQKKHVLDVLSRENK